MNESMLPIIGVSGSASSKLLVKIDADPQGVFKNILMEYIEALSFLHN
jgi:hypothetical protein